MPDLVKDTFEEAHKHNADIVQFPMIIGENDSKYSYNWTVREYQEYDKNNFFLYNGNTCTIMFKKELGDTLRKYIGSLSVNYHEDYIISIILSAFYKKVRYIDTAYYVYCDTDSSMTRQYSDEAILKYVRDTLIFIRFMKNLVPIIFPKENSDYLLTVTSNRIRQMKKQLNIYLQNSKNTSIRDLYNKTDKNKSFIMNSILYSVIQIKDTQLNHQKQELQQRSQKINSQTQTLQQRSQKINEQKSKIDTLLKDPWYRFGRMSKKRKIWTIGKVVSKKMKLYWLLQPIAKSLKNVFVK